MDKHRRDESKGRHQRVGNKLNLDLVTFNASGWDATRDFLSGTLAHVVFIQEHKVWATEVDDRRESLRKAGWQTVWTPAVRTQANGRAGGTLIAARQTVGLRTMKAESLQKEGRITTAIVDVPGRAPLQVGSLDLESGSGFEPCKLELWACLGQRTSTKGQDWLIAGDFNMSPSLLAVSGFPNEGASTHQMYEAFHMQSVSHVKGKQAGLLCPRPVASRLAGRRGGHKQRLEHAQASQYPAPDRHW